MTGTVLILSILLSIVTDAAYAIIVGTLLAGRWLAALESSPAPPASPRPPIDPDHPFCADTQRRIVLLCTLSLVLTHLIRPWLLAASMSGSTSLRENLALVPTILSSTHQGTLWYWNSAAVLLLLVSIFIRHRTPAIWTSLAALLVIAFAKAATGHASTQGDFTLEEIFQTIHILATAVWAGAVLVSGLIVLPAISRLRGHSAVWSYTASLSKSATYAVAAVLISGVYTSDRELNNTLAGLWTSTWGKILIVKVAFVLLALSLGATCRLLHTRAESTPQRSMQIVRLVTSEAVVMIVVICLSGLLGNYAPPMSNM